MCDLGICSPVPRNLERDKDSSSKVEVLFDPGKSASLAKMCEFQMHC